MDFEAGRLGLIQSAKIGRKSECLDYPGFRRQMKPVNIDSGKNRHPPQAVHARRTTGLKTGKLFAR
jgi:hypothetical protein